MRFITRTAALSMVVAASSTILATTAGSSPISSPPPGSAELRIWLSSQTVPTTGANLVAVVMNRTSTTYSHGVLGIFEHWTHGEWRSAGGWSSSLDQWGGFGALGSVGTSQPAIALEARAKGFGLAQYFTVPPLAPGWYRVGYRGGPVRGPHGGHIPSVYGVFRVEDGAQAPAPIVNPEGAKLTAEPVLLTNRGGEVSLVGFPGTDFQTFDQVKSYNESLAATVMLERWDGSQWQLGAVLATHPASPSQDNPYGDAVTVPHLASGVYRLIREGPDGQVLQRVIWVVSSLPHK